MKILLASMAAFGLLTAAAQAETQYDRRLEQAVVDIVAGKMGDIRGGFSFDARPVLISTPDIPPAAPEAMRGTYSAFNPWQDGLAPAIERRTSRGIF